MISNYLTSAARHLSRSVFFATINILGLVAGITSSLFLLLYVWDELRQDRFHQRAQDIYRITTHQEKGQSSVVTPGPLGAELVEKYPEIEQMARFGKWSGTFRYKNAVYDESEINFADHAFITMFDFPLVLGNSKNILLKPNEVLLTEKTASKYFGSEWRSRTDVLGSVFTLNSTDNFIVAGILADLPLSSSIQFDFIISFEHVIKNDPWGYKWDSHNFHTYLLLHPSTNVREFETRIKGEMKRHQADSNFDLGLQPLTNIYLAPATGYDWGRHGQEQYVFIFSIIAGVIVVIACFNYINLSTAQARTRAREVGVRKIIGARTYQLFFQFIGESLLIVTLSIILSRGLIDWLLPFFNQMSGKQLISSEFQRELTSFMFVVGSITTLLSGVYPAMLLSSFKPVEVLKGTVPAHKGQKFRSLLVTAQFTISMTLIVGTLVIYDQMFYIQSKSAGFNKTDLVYIKLGGELRDASESFKNDLLKRSYIRHASRSTTTLVNTDNGSYIDYPGKDPGQEITIAQLNADEDFIPMLDIELLEGRNFVATDSLSYILNEQAVKAMGLQPDKALGLRVKFWGTEGVVIGVVKDFHFRPLHHAISPLIMRHSSNESFFTMLIKIERHAMAQFQDEIEQVYKKYAAENPFQYGFVDEQIELQYQNERRVSNIVLCFSVLSIFISVLGLFGLVTYSVEVRTKEFSIRKVLGCSYSQIFYLLSKQFLWLLVAAFFIAAPIAWWLAKYWLQNFSYQVAIAPSVYIKAVLAVAIGSATVIFIQALRASRKNPAEVLKAVE